MDGPAFLLPNGHAKSLANSKTYQIFQRVADMIFVPGVVICEEDFQLFHGLAKVAA
jgi:hypothetical protein